MNAHDLLELLQRHAVTLAVEGDTLRCRAPRGVLTPELRSALARHKQQLISILAAEAAPPLTDAQRQLWLLDRLSPGDPTYNNPLALDLAGPLDRAALQAALTRVAARHDALRTVFVDSGGRPRQVVRPADAVPLPVTDLSHLPAPEREQRAREATEAAAREPFDLARGPLMRCALLRLGPSEHRFLLTVHHIVADGWSIGILLRELAALYSGQTLPALPVQYPEFALAQQRRRDAARAEHVRYWTQRLAGAPALLELPTDRPRPPVQRHRGALYATHVDPAVTRALRAVARDGDATLFMALMAALSVLLWRYSGSDDISVGTPVANRDHADAEGLIGHFVNTVVVRTRPRPDQTFAALLAEVRRRVLEAQEHAELPFDEVVAALAPKRHTSHTPLFQVMLALQDIPRGAFDAAGLVLRGVPTGTGAAKFDLSVEAMPSESGGLTVLLEYDVDLFDEPTVARLAEHFVRLLEQAAADPSEPVGRWRLLSPDEHRRQVYEWNATAVRRPIIGLVQRFEAQARSRPLALAVVGSGGGLDYATVDRRANRLAHALIARGVGRDQLVGLHLSRSPDLVVGILGVLKAGAGYLPLDPALPADRLATMVADAAPALVLSDSSPDWPALSIVEVESDRVDPPAVDVSPLNLAYTIFTSGSTGRPRGVAIPHGAVTNLLDDWADRVGVLPGEPAALWSSIGFDVSVHEILLPLTTGGALHLVPDDVRTDPYELMSWLAEHRVAAAYLPPAFVRWAGTELSRVDGLALRQLLVGVEPLPEHVLHDLRRRLPGLVVLNGYGPTETTVFSTAHLDPRPVPRPCPIGRPLANTRVYLLDERLEPVPVGVTGELHIAGSGLARGYAGNPGATAQRFRPDPFVAGERMYATGDLARCRSDGTLEFVGRRDHQVKVRGFRVELAEVEAALLREPGVREAAVVADTDGAGETRLAAGIARPEPPRLASEWRAALAQRLPGYLIPATFLELPALPRTSNGKVDRAELLRLVRAGTPVQVNTASPRDQVELTLYELWRGLLLHQDIGIHDNFFDVGGTSISAIRLAHAIHEAFGRLLPVRDIMLHPTIEALGGLLRSGGSGPPASNLIEFRSGDQGGRAGRIVCVHPAGGTAFCYLALAKVLGEQYGVYGIQSPGVNPGERFLPTIEAMAQAYLRLLESLPPAPTVLTGLSYGGLVAYEMGRLMVQSGRADTGVVLLDTLGTDDEVQRKAIEPVDMAEFRDKLVKFNGMYPGIADEQVARYRDIYNHNRMSMRDYVAAPSSLPLVLLQSTAGRDDDFLAEVQGFWRRRSGPGFRLEFTGTDHWELLESEQVHRVVELLGDELRRVTGGEPVVPR